MISMHTATDAIVFTGVNLVYEYPTILEAVRQENMVAAGAAISSVRTLGWPAHDCDRGQAGASHWHHKWVIRIYPIFWIEATSFWPILCGTFINRWADLQRSHLHQSLETQPQIAAILADSVLNLLDTGEAILNCRAVSTKVWIAPCEDPTISTGQPVLPQSLQWAVRWSPEIPDQDTAVTSLKTLVPKTSGPESLDILSSFSPTLEADSRFVRTSASSGGFDAVMVEHNPDIPGLAAMKHSQISPGSTCFIMFQCLSFSQVWFQPIQKKWIMNYSRMDEHCFPAWIQTARICAFPTILLSWWSFTPSLTVTPPHQHPHIPFFSSKICHWKQDFQPHLGGFVVGQVSVQSTSDHGFYHLAI